jgi:hypothetical protein
LTCHAGAPTLLEGLSGVVRAMLNLMWKLMYYHCLLFYQWGKLAYLHCLMLMPSVVLEARCARRMERMAARLSRMQGKILQFEKNLSEGCINQAIDADHGIREMLQGLKADIRTMRLEASSIRGMNRRCGLRLERALVRLHEVAEATYLAADRLLWEIEEHDTPYRASLS